MFGTLAEIGAVIACGTPGPITQKPTTRKSSVKKIPPINIPIGKYCSAPCLQFGEIDVEHHHDEQEQHGDRADIDHDQDHGEEFGAQLNDEQPGGVDETRG